jgi:hypothetical protein
MDRFEAGREPERLHGEMRDAPHAAGGIVHGAALFLRSSDEIRDVLVTF